MKTLNFAALLVSVTLFSSGARGDEARESALRENPYFLVALSQVLAERSQSPLPTMEWVALSSEEQAHVEALTAALTEQQRQHDKQLEIIASIVSRPMILNPADTTTWGSAVRIRREIKKFRDPNGVPISGIPQFSAASSQIADPPAGRQSPMIVSEYFEYLATALAQVVAKIQLSRTGAEALSAADHNQLSALGLRLLVEAYTVAALSHDESELAQYTAMFHGAGMVAGSALTAGLVFIDKTLATATLVASIVEMGVFARNIWARDLKGKAFFAVPWSRSKAAQDSFNLLLARFWLHFSWVLGSQNSLHPTEMSALYDKFDYAPYPYPGSKSSAQLLKQALDFLSPLPVEIRLDLKACEYLLQKN